MQGVAEGMGRHNVSIYISGDNLINLFVNCQNGNLF
jgi:hypothetical protein